MGAVLDHFEIESYQRWENNAGYGTLAGCPILAGLLFFRLGWDSTNLNRPRSVSRALIEPAGCPTLAGFLFFRLGWDSTKLNRPRSVSRALIEPAGCPTLAGFLFFRLGWDSTKLNRPRSVSRALIEPAPPVPPSLRSAESASAAPRISHCSTPPPFPLENFLPASAPTRAPAPARSFETPPISHLRQ